MKIALIDPSLFTLPYDVSFAAALRAQGHDVALHGRPVTPRDGAPDGANIEPSFYKLSAHLAALPKPLRLALKGVDHAVSLAGLLRRLRRDKPDIIHFQWLPLPFLDRALLQSFRRIAPVILTVHDTNPFNGDPTARLQRFGFLAALRACDHLIVHTQQGRSRLLANGLDAARISVIAHGVDRAPAVAGVDDTAGPVSFVLFGKIKPYKGADLLVDAFAALPAPLRQAANIRIVGQAYMKLDAIRQSVAAHGIGAQVTIEDRFVDDAEMPAIFGPNTVAVFPYREIEASGVLFQAIFQGRPIVASRIGLFAEALEDGVHGHLVSPEDVPALTKALAHIVEDRDFTRSCAAAIRALAQQTPDWSDAARMTTRLYERSIPTPMPTAPLTQAAI